jgi:hypothetical protein
MKIKIMLILLILAVCISAILTSCTRKPENEPASDEGITDNGDTLPDMPEEDNTGTEELPEEETPVTVTPLPEGHEFSRCKTKATLIPKTVKVTECFSWKDSYYYFVEKNDDNNDRLYYKSDKNYCEAGESTFVIGVGDYVLYSIFDRSAIYEYGYGFEPAGSELVILKTVGCDQYFEWNGDWYYFYEDVGFEVRFVKSDTPYHLKGMDKFWVKGRVEFYRFIQV